jgi:hypothetical protein
MGITEPPATTARHGLRIAKEAGGRHVATRKIGGGQKHYPAVRMHG